MSRKLVIIQGSTINETVENRCFLRLSDGRSVFEYLIDRLNSISGIHLIIGTSDQTEDDVFDEIANRKGIGIHRGSYKNVAGRLYDAARINSARNFIRVNANSPLIDIDKMLDMYDIHVNKGYDYSYNESINGVIWGMGCDVFKTELLKQISSDRILNDNQKEIVGLYIRNNPGKYRIQKYEYVGKRGDYKTNIESLEDYELVSDIIDNCKEISCESIQEYLGLNKLLSKYNRNVPSREAGVEKILFSPHKVESILKRNLPDMSYPISVELTLTNACNLNCVYCSDKELRLRQGNEESISLETLQGLFLDLAQGGTKGVVLEGGGEPTTCPYFDEVVKSAKKAGLAIGLITNGTSRIDSGLLECFEWIRVSLDASTEEEYYRLKGVNCYERVIENIAHYARYCPTVGVGYVVTNSNLSEIEALTIRIRELGAAYLQCRPVVDNPDLYPEGVDISYLKYYEGENFAVDIGGMKENASFGNDGLPCYAHSITSVISGDGSVYICGRLNIYDWLKPIGNIKENCFRKIWYGIERQEQAELLSDSRFCKKNCPQCRISKFNKMFARLDNVKTKHFI